VTESIDRRQGRTRGEQVRKALHLKPERGSYFLLPFVLQGTAVAATNINAGQRPGSGVEPRCENQNIQFVFLTTGQGQPLLSDTINRVRSDVHQFHVVAVEGLEITIL